MPIKTTLPTPLPLRRNPRDQASIFIIVSGFDSAGHFFTEHTATTNVSENGCCFRLNRNVAFDALLAVQAADVGADARSRPVLFQVAWMEQLVRGAMIGAARLHGESSWHLAMPPHALEPTKA